MKRTTNAPVIDPSRKHYSVVLIEGNPSQPTVLPFETEPSVSEGDGRVFCGSCANLDEALEILRSLGFSGDWREEDSDPEAPTSEMSVYFNSSYPDLSVQIRWHPADYSGPTPIEDRW